jgi:hypothetical protein
VGESTVSLVAHRPDRRDRRNDLLGRADANCPRRGHAGPGLFKRVGMLLMPLFVVLAMAAIIIAVAGKALGIWALIEAPRVLRGERESDKLVVRRKINEAPPRLRHKISHGPIFLIPRRWAG